MQVRRHAASIERKSMIYKCKNCDGNMVYSPPKKAMYCPYCESTDSHDLAPGRQGLTVCANCGGELHINDFTSASQCPYCGNYIIFDERVEGEYTPHLILPFNFDKEMIKKLLREKFKSCVFAPSDFLSDAKLDSMTGMYVPFWMYDYHAESSYDGQGTKVRTWVSGNKQYTETSVYHVVREMETEFDKIPVDASDAMPDSTMDLMEPYDYKALEQFRVEYMSGFFAEKYNQDASYMEYRAQTKAVKDAEELLNKTLTGFTALRPVRNGTNVFRKEVNYSLLPVWIYNYKYKGTDFRFHVNGQTGKIVGKTPLSKGKVVGYGATVFGSLLAIMLLIRQFLSLL